MIKSFLKKKLVYLLLIVIGILLVFLALSKLSGNLLIALSVIGAIIMILGFWKSVKGEAIEGALAKDKLARVAEDYEKLKQEHLKLISEHKSLHDMKINVSNIKPLVEIGLFEAETEFTQFVDQYFDQHFNEIHDPGVIDLIKTTPSNYVERFNDNPIRISGALHFKIDAVYGIKVDEISIKTYVENGLPHVDVYGAKPKFLSFKSRNVAWKSPIALRFSSPMVIGKETWKTDKKLLEPYNRFIDTYREKVIAESEKGPKELEWIKKPLENQIKSMLSILFFKGYAINFVQERGDDFITLNEFANSKLIEDANLELLSNFSQSELSSGSESLNK